MPSFAHEELTIEAVEEPETSSLRVTWRGRSSARNPPQVLMPFFQDLLAIAEPATLAMEHDFTQLEHFNSSTVTALIQLIQAARAKGVKLGFLYDAKIRWQKLSFDALRVFAKADGLLTVRTAT